MPKLNLLHIRFRGELRLGSHGIGMPSTFGTFISQQHFENLRDIHFHGLVAMPSEFKKFLRQHSATLQNLYLTGDTWFSDRFVSPDDLFETPMSEKLSKFAWIDMIVFLGLEMSLEDFCFEDHYITCGDELWTNSYYELNWVIPPAPPRPIQTLLYYRILAYVIHKGECPFREKALLDKRCEDWHSLSEWEYEEDNSWCFQKSDPRGFYGMEERDYQHGMLVVEEEDN